MKKLLFISLFLALLFPVKSQNPFSDSTVVSILTCSPGPAVYARYGHTGLRFFDPQTRNDVVFNYGMFSFSEDNFILKFVKGHTYYQLAAEHTVSFMYQYEARNSSITEQILNLTPDERKRIIDLVLENYKPENRTYLYNFVFDNCATRPFYKISEGIAGEVIIDTLANRQTFRQWVAKYVGTDKWLMFGIDLGFGSDADKMCTPEQSLFLPEILMEHLNSAKIIDPEGERNLVSAVSVLVNAKKGIDISRISFSPVFVNTLILIILSLLTILTFKNQKGLKWITFILLIISGLVGVLLAFLMFISIHPLVHYNWNILWLNPLNLIAACLLFSDKFKKFIFYYILISALLIVLLAIIAIFNVQYFNPAEYPLWILYVFLYLCRLKDYSKFFRTKSKDNGELKIEN